MVCRSAIFFGLGASNWPLDFMQLCLCNEKVRHPQALETAYFFDARTGCMKKRDFWEVPKKKK